MMSLKSHTARGGEPQMTQDDLFGEESAVLSAKLPMLRYGPIGTEVGPIQSVLREASEVAASFVGEVQTSPRIRERAYKLPNGETVIVTTRRTTERPPDVDGVLLRDPHGELKWLHHSAIDALEARAKKYGWPFVIEDRARQWENRLSFRKEWPNPDGSVDEDKRGLRPPQLGALHAIGSHWSLQTQPGTIVMPTGTGKTETMLATLAAYVRKPMLVVVPSDALRSQTARKFLTFGLLRWLKVLDADVPNPIVGVVTKVPKTAAALEIFERCNVIIGTMSSLADADAESHWPEIVKRIGVLVIDEAHHVGAQRWTKFREAFAGTPVLQFTATPFRRDGNIVDGQVIYSYPLRMAQADGYFKPIVFEPVYEAVQTEADRAIAEAAVGRLRDDLDNGLNHLVMARCLTIDRAKAVHALYMTLARDLNPLLVHSDMTGVAERIEDLKHGRSRIVVCVNMLGEGFDLPELKIAAIHDLHKSLAILLQFIGRFTRTAATNIGNATVVANITEPSVSAALERLYSEDADWNDLLSEMSSEAANDHARLTKFLNEAKRLDNGPDDEDTAISQKLLRPTLSTLFYEAQNFAPRKFHEGLPASFVPYRVWLHEPSRTLYFVTRSDPPVKWSRSKAVRDRIWNLFILHHDIERQLLYLSSTDHDSTFSELAKAVGATNLISGDVMFRSMGRINRLIFQNFGAKKHGRRNLSYVSYTGAEVTTALSAAEKSGSVKAMLSGMGWEGGRQVTIGCSGKGRAWSREQGSVPRFNDWCETIGDKLVDASIDTSKLIDHVLLPTVVSELPKAELLSIEWPIEMLRQAEERITFSDGTRSASQTTFDLVVTAVDRTSNTIDFSIIEALTGSWATFRYSLGIDYSVSQTSGPTIGVTIGKLSNDLAAYFTEYPPLFRFVDLSELDANLHIVPQNPYDLTVDDALFESWDWTGVDLEKESMWKGDVRRDDSVQWRVAKEYVQAGFDVVFDDDASGEAADLVCIKAEVDYIKLVLVHCKFAGGATPGARVKDVVEVSSQAVRSVRWIGKFPQLMQHLKTRNEALKVGTRTTRFLKGASVDLNRLVKAARFSPIRAEIIVVQPGLTKANRTPAQSAVLAAAVIYLKETVGIDLGVICS
jgi:superfamily II DNA or RNA helicase